MLDFEMRNGIRLPELRLDLSSGLGGDQMEMENGGLGFDELYRVECERDRPRYRWSGDSWDEEVDETEVDEEREEMVPLGTTEGAEAVCSATMFNTMMNRSRKSRRELLAEANRESARSGRAVTVPTTTRIRFSDRVQESYI
uniref:Uncharacterized protein n=1 Tax=Compsopogon caeruleus TaxID=31354 RepID=A0A7S1TDX8_9RHOD|mmetsp:Transcript_1872/g.3402  ORF Transcript_1872/g.3402 Transcript_1872/m.3402 type:complete len:142 (+) Transcript_1872:167-592(+)|eukprot:CAMPEP_0184682516 /NCGR_PEP_ID=MMETSP0312-20130426/7534_1 /TAXON_ID=31354 /ORGANISM="Compsopogon coeruleus, Strain SAG 36.94" /LENGTH=141 /DNA_ID=CAMNT_0027134223 /DNA_START=92 /DNA_END=517 /DNA_ORIENTATION=-